MSFLLLGGCSLARTLPYVFSMDKFWWFDYKLPQESPISFFLLCILCSYLHQKCWSWVTKWNCAITFPLFFYFLSLGRILALSLSLFFVSPKLFRRKFKTEKQSDQKYEGYSFISFILIPTLHNVSYQSSVPSKPFSLKPAGIVWHFYWLK